MATTKTLFYQKPSCTTCRKAKDLLRSLKIDFVSRDLDQEKLSESELDALIGTRDYKGFLSTRNELYRELNMGEKPPTRSRVDDAGIWIAHVESLASDHFVATHDRDGTRAHVLFFADHTPHAAAAKIRERFARMLEQFGGRSALDECSSIEDGGLEPHRQRQAEVAGEDEEAGSPFAVSRQ